MKKMLLVLMAMVFCSTMAFAACPPTIMKSDEACSLRVDLLEQAGTFFYILGALDFPGAPTSITTADIDADGLPDIEQINLLSSLLCGPNGASVQSQLDANKAVYATLISQFQTAIDTGTPVPALMTTAGADAQAVLTALTGSGLESSMGAIFTLVVGAMAGGAEDLQGSIDDFNTYLFLLAQPIDYVAAEAGISSEAKAYVSTFYSTLLAASVTGPVTEDGGINDQVTLLQTIAAAMTNDTYLQAVLAQNGAPAPLIPTIVAGWNQWKSVVSGANAKVLASQASLGAAALGLHNLGLALLAVQDPAFGDTFGCSKLATEPFAGAGDYDGNGQSNAEVYAAVGGGAAFVAAASGSNPFYPGNPSLPVAGLAGLVAMAGAMAAYVARKRK